MLFVVSIKCEINDLVFCQLSTKIDAFMLSFDRVIHIKWHQNHTSGLKLLKNMIVRLLFRWDLNKANVSKVAKNLSKCELKDY